MMIWICYESLSCLIRYHSDIPLLQGYGLFVMEQLLHSPEGSLLTRGPGAYKIPSFNDVPLIIIIIIIIIVITIIIIVFIIIIISTSLGLDGSGDC